MRCPKCQYLSFDSTDRCRNCGYEFALAQQVDPEPDVTARVDADREPVGPLADLELRPAAPPPPAHPARDDAAAAPADAEGRTARRSVSQTPDPRGFRARRVRDEAPRPASFDLPLFQEPVPGADDTPLITAPSTPRNPLSVRRGTETSRSGGVPGEDLEAPRLDDDLSADFAEPPEDEEPPRPVVERARRREPVVEPRAAPPDVEAPLDPPAAPWGARLGAGLIDLLILGAIDFTVVRLTLRMLGMHTNELLQLPLVPLVSFLLLLNGGYLVMFTAASGQTIGKMLFHLRVIGQERLMVGFGQSVVRAACAIVTILPLGAGLVPGLFSPDRRALHDRAAGTRVARV